MSADVRGLLQAFDLGRITWNELLAELRALDAAIAKVEARIAGLEAREQELLKREGTALIRAIEAEARVAELEAERDRAVKEARAAVPLINRQRERAEAVEAREAALRDALERLASPTSIPRTEEAALIQIEVEGIARAALAALPADSAEKDA